jgi:RNA polymerase sigma-70 factor (ECF subfamily)
MQLTATQITSGSVPANMFLSRAVFERQLVEILPKLRAFAWKLTRNDAEADDLVQETAAKALRAYRRFQIGTSMQAWTFTILRNHRINEFRKQAARVEELTEAVVLRNPVKGNQDDNLELSQTFDAMERLKSAHCEVLTLVRLLGHNYGQAAKLMACPIGTIKSRLNRADAALRATVER